MLPFDCAPDFFTVGAISLPRYGCPTVQEAIAFEELLAGQADLLEVTGDQATIIAAMHLNPVIATLILISRHDPNWTLEKVSGSFSIAEIAQIADFALGERRRWKDLNESEPEQADTEPSKPTDWAEVYWTLQLHFPHEPRFSAARFASCPLLLIEQAIAAATRLELERAHRAAIPTALLGCYLLAAQGIKDLEPAHFNPFERMLNQQAAVEEIDPAIARTLIGLIDSGRVPTWAIPLIPLGKMRLAASA